MVCGECKAKMACRYSVPMPERTRFRAYRCGACGTWQETVEVPVEVIVNEELKGIVAQARRQRFIRIGAKRK